MRKANALLLFLGLVLCSAVASPSAIGQTRSLGGSLQLDTGVAAEDLRLEITVNNHIIIVQPPFSITRPITSSESTEVVMLAGQDSIDYLVTDILPDPVDFTVQISCLGCSSSIPDQYYSMGGNRLGLQSDVFIDPEDLPELLDFNVISRARISGTIDLGAVAERDLMFAISVASNVLPERIYQSGTTVTLPNGSTRVDYQLLGLNREIGDDLFRVVLQCLNCSASSAVAQLFPTALSPLQNHSGIDFQVTDEGPIFTTIAPMLDLLLND